MNAFSWTPGFRRLVRIVIFILVLWVDWWIRLSWVRRLVRALRSRPSWVIDTLSWTSPVTALLELAVGLRAYITPV